MYVEFDGTSRLIEFDGTSRHIIRWSGLCQIEVLTTKIFREVSYTTSLYLASPSPGFVAVQSKSYSSLNFGFGGCANVHFS